MFKSEKAGYSGLTLVELILGVVLCSVVMAVAVAGYNFIFNQIRRNIEMGSLNLQVDYALENIRLHTLSALNVTDVSMFKDGELSHDYFCFRGEKDIYNVTPNIYKDNFDYCYRIDQDNLMLSATDITTAKITTETLIDDKYKPKITFEYNETKKEPSLLTVSVTATAITTAGSSDTQMVRQEDIRLWFTKVKK